MIRHHPHDDMLLAHVAGSLPAGPALLLATHVEGCVECRERVLALEAVGGALLDDAAPAALSPEAFTRTLTAIDAPRGPTTAVVAAPAPAFPALPTGAVWPASFTGCRLTRWRWLGPGVRWSRVTLPHGADGNVFLLRIGAGKRLPRHTHSNVELTQVMYGSFDDGHSAFGAGDFDAADGNVRHQPVVHPRGECICLASVEGRVVFEGYVAHALGALVGM